MSESLTKLVEKHFDQYASNTKWQSYYKLNNKSFNYAFKLRQDCFRNFMDKVQPTSVLDVGCGSGDFLMDLPSSVKTYHGFDLSREMIEASNNLYVNQLKPSLKSLDVKFTVAQVQSFTPEIKFDFVIASGLTEYFDDIQQVVCKLSSFVASGAYVAIQTPNRKFFRWKGQHKIFSKEKSFSHHRLSCDELDNMATEAGLTKITGCFVSYSVPKLINNQFTQRLINRIAKTNILNPFSEKLASMYIALYRKN